MFERRKRRSGAIIALFGLLIAATAAAFETFPIAREPGHQQLPAVDDCTVVWQTNRNGDWDIALADISYPGSVNPLMLADALSEAQSPAISGNVIVWQNQFFLYEDYDIVGLDLSTETFFTVVESPADECSPAVCGNLVIAQSRVTAHADWDILGVDIADRANTLPFWLDRNAEDQWRPDIDDGIVIYEDVYDGTSYVSGWDLSDLDDAAWFPVRSVVGPCQSPAIAGKWVVWQDQGEETTAAAGDNIFDPRLPRLLDLEGSVEASNPDVYNNVVVWQDRRNGNWDIYGYNLTTKTAFPIVSQDADQTHPAITFSPWLKAYVVVWQDYRNGNWDIYGAILNGPEVAGCASPLTGDVDADSITDAKDIDEVDARLGQQNGIPVEAD